MRHRYKKDKLGRTASHRKALLKNLAVSLFLYERIKTNKAKAKALKGFVDRVVSRAKSGGELAERRIEKLIGNKLAAKKVIEIFVPRYVDRTSGFTTLSFIGRRKGDDGEVMLVGMVGSELEEVEKKVKGKKAKKSKKADRVKGQERKLGKSEKQGVSVLDRIKGLGGKIRKTVETGTKSQTDTMSGEALKNVPRSRSGI